MAQRIEKRASQAARKLKAVNLSIQGKSYETIAEACGYSTPEYARTVIRNEYRKRIALADEKIDELRRRELDHLYDLRDRAYSVLEDGGIYIAASGKVVKDDNGKPYKDNTIMLQAMDRLLKIQERISRLIGIDTPVKVEAEFKVNYSIGGVDMNKMLGVQSSQDEDQIEG